uniref:Protein kinase domain-containing protein n=1 Tax=Romanomermis culicivorax TaxID=13658 RepID=A0A915HLH0_ROMCU
MTNSHSSLDLPTIHGGSDDTNNTIDIGDYRFDLADKLGEGGYGKVYKGRQKSTGSQVAIKRILMTPTCGQENFSRQNSSYNEAQERENAKILAEFKAASKVQCTFVVNILKIVENLELNSTFMVMELCDSDLDRFLTEYECLNENNLETVAKSLAEGYMVLLTNGVFHRDIKPQNILLKYRRPLSASNALGNSSNNLVYQEFSNNVNNSHTLDSELISNHSQNQMEIECAKLADFGLSKIYKDDQSAKSSRKQSSDAEATSPSTSNKNQLCNLAGTFYFMAPEVGANVVHRRLYNERADMWSMGVVLYLCITGELPFNEQQICKLFLRAIDSNYFGYEPPTLMPAPKNVPTIVVGCSVVHASDIEKIMDCDSDSMQQRTFSKYEFAVKNLLNLDPQSRMTPQEFRACMFLDYTAPLKRLKEMLSGCGGKVVVGERSGLKRAPSDVLNKLISFVKIK